MKMLKEQGQKGRDVMRILFSRKEDNLDTARGIMNGCIVSLAMWAGLITGMLVAAYVMR